MTRHLIWLAPCAMLMCGCGQNPSNSTSGSSGSSDTKPVAVATTPMIADLVRAIAGDELTVETLLTVGVDPHTYQANGAEIRMVTSADIVFFNGLKLEAMEKDLRKNGSKRPGRVIPVGETVPKDRLRVPADHPDHPDPHIWMDVALWSKTVPAIVDGLKLVVPEASTDFDTRADELLARLQKLDAYVQQVVATIPETQRYLVTAHDAFGYFADAYGIEVASVQGVSTESQAGVEDIQRLVTLIVEKQVPSIFAESSVPARNVAAVLEGAQAKGAQVDMGEELFSDSAGAAETWEGTYFGMIEHNVNALAKGLGGTVPDGGFRAYEASSTTEAIDQPTATPTAGQTE